MPGDRHAAEVNTPEYLFRGTSLLSHVYSVFLIQGEINVLVCGRLYLMPLSYPQKYDWVCSRLTVNQTA